MPNQNNNKVTQKTIADNLLEMISGLTKTPEEALKEEEKRKRFKLQFGGEYKPNPEITIPIYEDEF